jgi:hypothetical protein
VTKVTLENRVLQEHKANKAYKENKDHVVLKATPENLARTVQTAQTGNQDHRENKALED